MTLSLGEAESLAKKATRGAGYPWGLAEEAGKATRWLCQQGLDGLQPLAQLLERSQPELLLATGPDVANNFCYSDAIKCPLQLGTYLSDSAAATPPVSSHIPRVASPTLLLPFVAHIAITTKQEISMTDGRITAVTDGAQLSIPELFATTPATIEICQTQFDGVYRRTVQRVETDSEIITRMYGFADATHAPATEQSRLLGAGAGLSDND